MSVSSRLLFPQVDIVNDYQRSFVLRTMSTSTANEKIMKGQTAVPTAPSSTKPSSGLSMKALPKLALGAALVLGYFGFNGTPDFIAERFSIDVTKGLCPVQGTAINVGKDWVGRCRKERRLTSRTQSRPKATPTWLRIGSRGPFRLM